MRLRQVALVARELDPVTERLCQVLGIEVGFHDPGVATFGLVNAVMPVGDTFLEVVSPDRAGTTAGRLLDRRDGDGGYMVLFQTDDLDADRRRLETLGVRVVWEIALEDIRAAHLHPRDVGAAIVSLDEPVPPPSWRWGGPDWEKHVRTDVVSRITGAIVQGADPAALAKRWSEVLGQPVRACDEGHEMPLEGGRVVFVAERDGRGEGVQGVELALADPERFREAARAHGVLDGDGAATLGGARFVPRDA